MFLVIRLLSPAIPGAEAGKPQVQGSAGVTKRVQHGQLREVTFHNLERKRELDGAPVRPALAGLWAQPPA